MNTAFTIEKYGRIYSFKVTFEETEQLVICQAKCYWVYNEQKLFCGDITETGFSYSQAYLKMLDNIKPFMEEVGKHL